jgi:hypothetical protein
MLRLLMCLCVLLISSASAQQELIGGQQYAAGLSVKSSYFGVSLRTPGGFTGAYSDQNGSAILAFNSDTIGIIAIFQHGANRAEYLRLLAQPFPISAQLTLQPVTEPLEQGTTLSVTYSSDAGVDGLGVALRSQTGSSVLVLGFGKSGLEGLRKAVAGVTAQVKFTTPLAVRGDANLRQQWAQTLRSKIWSRSSSTGSNSVNGSASTNSLTQLALCADSRFEYKSQTSVSVSVPGGDFGGSSSSSNGGDELAGRWSLEFLSATGAVLALTDENGLQRRFVLTVRGNNLLIDNRVWTPSALGC